MKRVLQGRLAHLSPPTLLRLLAATRGSGLLRLETPDAAVNLEVSEGWIAPLPLPVREALRVVLSSVDGSYRFEPGHGRVEPGDRIDLATLVDEVRGSGQRFASDFAIDDLASLVAGAPGASDPIHVLPTGPPQNPLGDLLAELEANAPEELLLAEVGVVAVDPRPWRGSLETAWRRRGWRVRLIAAPEAVPVDELDLVVVHHRLSITRVGREEDWLDLLVRCEQARPPVSVVWAGPLGDPAWVNRLIERGVAFLMPPPQGEGGEVAHRFADALTLVVDRELRRRGSGRSPELAGGVAELLDALLHGSDPGQAVGALLQLASTQVARGAVLLAEPEAIRCRAGFGFPLDHGLVAMPRGVGVLERVVRSGEPVLEVDAESAGVQQLARVLGLEGLSPATAILPLGRGGATDGLLVVDRGGQPLPDLTELCLVARRLGGAVVAGLRSN